jgi:hypothetical protein
MFEGSAKYKGDDWVAAAWVPALPVVTIATELAANLDVQETTLRDVPERHRSARAVFAHSWNLLTAAERALFGQLCVFRSGFTLQAAQQIADAILARSRGWLTKLMGQAGDGEQAVELLALVHSAADIDRCTEAQAERLLAELEARLSPANFAAA